MLYRSGIHILALVAMLAGAEAVAQALPAGIGMGETAKGKVLTDARGRSLYVFDKEKDGMPACYDKCTELWPPLMAPAGMAAMGDYATVARKDGALQIAYKGRPLYTWHKDAAPGDVDGDGFRDLWHLARP